MACAYFEVDGDHLEVRGDHVEVGSEYFKVSGDHFEVEVTTVKGRWQFQSGWRPL